MKIFDKLSIKVATVVLGICTPLHFANADNQVAIAAEKGHPLTAKELNSIYDDHSWRWKDGAAYFGEQNRVFKAWVGEGEKSTYAEGSWSANDRGRLCFYATWYGKKGHKAASTCLEHRADETNIFQRKLPNGDWYIFSHIPPLSDDEIQKLQPGDNVSEHYKMNQRYVYAHVGRR